MTTLIMIPVALIKYSYLGYLLLFITLIMTNQYLPVLIIIDYQLFNLLHNYPEQFKPLLFVLTICILMTFLCLSIMLLKLMRTKSNLMKEEQLRKKEKDQ